MSRKSYDLIWKLIICVIAYILAWGLTMPYVFRAEGLLEPGDILFFAILLVLAGGLFWVKNSSSKRVRRISILPGLILGLCNRIGTEFYATGHLDLKNAGLYLGVLITGAIFWMIIVFLYTKIENSNLAYNIAKKGKIAGFVEKRPWVFYFLIILICWIPAFLATFPGIYSYDAYPQVLQIIGGQGLSAHHPLLHTWLLNGCFILGNSLTGDYNTGLMLYTVIQLIFMAAVFGYAMKVMREYAIPGIVRIFALLFFAVNPIIQIWVCLTTKDTIFAGFFLLVLLDLIRMVVSPEKIFRSKARVIRFICIGTLMCLFRNQGIYIVYLLLIFLVVFFRHYRKQCLIALLPVILLVNLFTGPVSDAIGVSPANPREALSVPVQQMARVLTQEPERVTEEEKEIVYQYIPEGYINQYIPVTSDLVKEGFNAELFKEAPLPFFKVWLSIGLKNFSAYVDAFLYLSCGYFYTDYTPYWVEFILYDGAWLDNGQNILNIERNTLFPAYDGYLRGVAKNLSHENIPLVSTILNEAFPFVVLVFVSGYLLARKRYLLLLPLLAVFGFWGTMLLGPVIAIRYAFPIIVCVPVMIALLFWKERERTENKKELEEKRG